MTMTKQEAIEQATYEANSAKAQLIHIMDELEEAGAISKAKSLGTIIEKLENWQNK